MDKLLVSFDFDDTISGKGDYIAHICQILKNHIIHGDEVMILTARDPSHDNEEWFKVNSPERVILKPYLESLGLSHLTVAYTSHELKGPHAKRLGVTVHYDNDPNEITSCREHGVIAIPIGHEHDDPTLHKTYVRHHAGRQTLPEMGEIDLRHD